MSAGKAAVDLAEGLEGDLDLCGRHSRSCIPHFEHDPAILGVADGETDRAAGIGKLDGVRQQVEHDLRQPGRIRDHTRHPIFDLQRQAKPAGDCLLFHQSNAGSRDAGEIDVLLFMELKLSRVDLREIEDIIDNAQQEPATLANIGDVSLLLRVEPPWDAGRQHL